MLSPYVCVHVRVCRRTLFIQTHAADAPANPKNNFNIIMEYYIFEKAYLIICDM